MYLIDQCVRGAAGTPFYKVVSSYDNEALFHIGGFAMGDFTKRLTERRMHTKIAQGHCLICGSYGELSWDHVPPKGSITITKIEQMHLTEVMALALSQLKV